VNWIGEEPKRVDLKCRRCGAVAVWGKGDSYPMIDDSGIWWAPTGGPGLVSGSLPGTRCSWGHSCKGAKLSHFTAASCDEDYLDE